jgi:hypothetical protein
MVRSKKSICTIISNPDNISSEGEFVQSMKRKHYSELVDKSRLHDDIINQATLSAKLNQILIDHGVFIKDITLALHDPEIPKPKINIFFVNKTVTRLRDDSEKYLQLASMVKDQLMISDFAWASMRKLLELDIPSIYYIRNSRYQLNENLPKLLTNIHGIYYIADEKIKWVLEKKIKNMKIKNNTVRISLRGDKTISGRNQSFFNFCFSLPDEGNIAKTASGQYTLGFFDVDKDDYATMSVALKEIRDNLKDLNFKIEIDGILYEIEWSLSGDMVWHKCERGLDSCNSKYPCFQCRIARDDFYKHNFDILNRPKKNKLRSVEESKKFLTDESRKNKEGYVHEPIFDFIPFKNVCIDTLHEHIRIPLHLIKLTYRKLILFDNSKSTDLNKLKSQKKLIDWLVSIGIKNPFKVKGEGSKESDPYFTLKSYSGKRCLKISKLIHNEILSDLKDGDEIVALFNNYFRLHQGYKYNFYKDKIELFQQRVDIWKDDFLKIFHRKHVTPYIHYFTDHLSTAIKHFGDVGLNTLQG